MSQSVPAEHPPPGGLGAGLVPSVQQDGPCPLPPKAGGTRWPVTTDGNHCHRVPHSLQTPTPRSPGAHRLRTVAGTMKILTCPAQLQRLEEILRKSLPLALPVFGAVLNINRGNPGQYEILVDKWPEFGAVLARPSGEVPVNDGYWNTQTAFYRDLGAYRVLVETPGCLPWDAAFTLIGLQDGVTTVSQDLAGKKGVELDIVEYYSYWHPDPSTMPEPRPAPGVRLGSLSPSHVDLLNDTWPYGGNARSRRYLAELLRRFPQVCLQDSSGKPVAWVLTDHFGTGTHSYTLPEHRRHGHMQVALTVAAQRAHAHGFPTFGHTALRNQPMQQLQELLGNQRLPGICSYILHNPSLDRDGP